MKRFIITVVVGFLLAVFWAALGQYWFIDQDYYRGAFIGATSALTGAMAFQRWE